MKFASDSPQFSYVELTLIKKGATWNSITGVTDLYKIEYR
ncbi:hypothetical protein LEP1GSC073_3559 [Leptospira noguchii str. Cascata]|nr:hypothetical protein LEP1GSC073_3559 [Leptospira noguchii str. Cascata]